MINNEEKFNGDKKVGRFLFETAEARFKRFVVPRIPPSIETYHLTISSIVWSLLIILFGYLSQSNINWLWGTIFMIVCQYFTDLFDGAVGRYRQTGLVKWGYYMDHLLDYFFLCSLCIGYSFVFNDQFNTLFFIMAIFVGYMVNSYLEFAATNNFRVSFLGIGPTELRLVFIIINVLLVVFNKTYLAWALPYTLIISLIGLIVLVYYTQKRIWAEDMEIKEKNQCGRDD